MFNKHPEFTKFEKLKKKQIKKFSNLKIKKLSKAWMVQALKHDYNYYYSWLGVPIIQYPNDLIAIQEIIWKTEPDIIIETGVAHGGSLIFYSSILQIMKSTSISKKQKRVIGVEIDFRRHNEKRLESHPLYKNIQILKGSSIDYKIFLKLKKITKGKKILVILDSNHTHDHVLEELRLYSKLIKKNEYIIVLDTGVEDLPNKYFQSKSWGRGNNPKTAVHEFLKENKNFKIDPIDKKLQISCAPDGFLFRKK